MLLLSSIMIILSFLCLSRFVSMSKGLLWSIVNSKIRSFREVSLSRITWKKEGLSYIFEGLYAKSLSYSNLKEVAPLKSTFKVSKVNWNRFSAD